MFLVPLTWQRRTGQFAFTVWPMKLDICLLKRWWIELSPGARKPVCNINMNKEGTFYLLVISYGAHCIGCKPGRGGKLHFVTPFGINDKVSLEKKKHQHIFTPSFILTNPTASTHFACSGHTLTFHLVVFWAKNLPFQHTVSSNLALFAAKNRHYFTCFRGSLWQNSKLVQMSSVEVNFLTARSSDLDLFGGRVLLVFSHQSSKIVSRDTGAVKSV